MAANIANVIGFTDKRRVQGQTTSVVANAGNYTSEPALDTRLAAANAGYYTAARLNTLTFNDKVYALRLIDDAAGL